MSLLRKKIISDSLINLMAAIVPLIALQLVVLPLMASEMTEEAYGFALTILSLLNICPSVLGNTLNNVRLINKKDYEKLGERGDFNSILLVCVLLNAAIVSVCSVAYGEPFGFGVVMIVATSTMWLAREFFVVAYLEKLQFKHVLVSNVVLTAGYFFGLFLLSSLGDWEWVYLAGNAFSLIYIMATTKIWREPGRITSLFKQTLTNYVQLVASGLIGRMISYADRLLLYPLLGGAAVSIYYVSTLFGKIVSVAVGPVSNVLLSHLSGTDVNNRKDFFTALAAGFAVCSLGCVGVIFACEPCLRLLYPQFVDSAMPYVAITTITAFVSALSSLLNPFVLRFSPMKYQILLNAATLFVYVVASLVLLSYFGLMGFCVGVLAATFLKLLLQIAIYVSSSTSKKASVNLS